MKHSFSSVAQVLSPSFALHCYTVLHCRHHASAEFAYVD